jgi:hypothetical protein
VPHVRLFIVAPQAPCPTGAIILPSQAPCPTGAIIFAVPHVGHDPSSALPLQGRAAGRVPRWVRSGALPLQGRAAGRAPRAPFFFFLRRLPNLATAPCSTRTLAPCATRSHCFRAPHRAHSS